jgi:predicted Holliday junction resolvase-like endonuclease
MTDRVAAILALRRAIKQRLKIQRRIAAKERELAPKVQKLKRLRALEERLNEHVHDAEYNAARTIRRDGVIELDGRRYTVTTERFGDVLIPRLMIDPLDSALLALAEHNCPEEVP